MRKKVILISLLCAMVQKGYSQQNVGDVVTTPVASPSMAAMSRYSDVPISLSSGLPEIDLPLLNAPLSDDTAWPISLSYNTQNSGTPDTASDVGAGWSFFGAAMIYKKVINGLDECYDNESSSNYQKNEFDDIYYYNLPGLSGKFRIKRDTVNNTFTLINLTPNHVKIDFIRNSNTATFKADSFTITADNGYQYIFTDYDAARYGCGEFFMGNEYKTAYYLTRILNPIGVETVAVTYDKKTKYKGTNNQYLIFQQNKIKTITSRKGQVAFDYVYDETLENQDAYAEAVSDPYSLQKIYLKNPAGETLYSYAFNYTMLSVGTAVAQKKRILNSVVKNDKNNTLIEKNTFVYTYPSGDGALKKIVSPTGGVAEYNYEQGELYFNFNDPAFLAGLSGASDINYPNIQYSSAMASGSINTTQSLIYNFNIPGDQQVKKNFKFILNITDYERPDPPPPPLKPKEHNLKITLKRGTEVIIPSFTITDNLYDQRYNLNAYPGNYTLEIVRTGEAKANGTFSSSEIKVYPGPFRNASKSGHMRIKNIKYYKDINNTAPQRTVNYSYDSFDLSDSASGYLFENEKDSDDDIWATYTLYKNVKVSEAGKGSIRYSFKNPDDYPKQQTGGGAFPEYFWPYYNITKAGLLFKKENYDEQNILLTTESYDYELDNFSNNEYSFTAGSKITSKPAYIKKSIVSNKAYFAGGGLLETGSETWMSPANLKPYYTKSIADGDTSEQFMTYVEGLAGYSHLEAANMTGVPVITEEKKNGKTLSKSVTKYDNPSLLLPTSAFAANISDGSMKQVMTADAYDDKGNLVQLTSVVGLSTSFIYGYNKTQIIAKIEGAKYDDIKNSPLVIAAVNASNDDLVNPASENALVMALDNLRKDSSMTGYQITAYTYNPLIGLTTTTTPNGQRETYEYDSSGRLKTVRKMEKDASGNAVYKTVKEYKYNYKQ
ncbi:RHS repeat domain-containing protein [Chryseobacterium lathyri]|uniref:RHS repeat domain-containing protein n=1 Tax=Chryseobacterium lathyri TaxID=395933 RepID=UPI001CBF9845|nr:RHS repeat domain-containing protein [Chryseobacterium lathyri]